MPSLSKTFRELRERGLENVFQRFYSAYQATVTDCNDDKQIGRGRVHLKSIGFPDVHPGFADVLSPYAGEDFGFFFPPYENDEVYVTFDHGDVSSPMVVGGSWATRGDRKVEDSGLPVEFVKSETNDEGKEVGVAPSVRGIKVRTGSALVFDETEDLTRVEMWTGETQGIGKRAIKQHRVRLDSKKDNGEVVIATFGDEGGSGGAPSDDDTPDVRDQKELTSRLRHQILMRDTTDDRFVQIKSIGTDDTMKFLQVLMSDTEERIKVTSSDQHFILIDDKNDNITVETLLKFKTTWDEKNKKIVQETPGLQKFTMDDNKSSNTLETKLKQVFKQDAEGTVVTEPVGAFNVTATTPSTHTYAAALTHAITGAWTASASLLSLTTTGVMGFTGTVFTFMGTAFTFIGANFTYTGATFVAASPAVVLGTGSPQPLVNATGLATYNLHTHIVVGVTPGFALATLNPMIPGNDSTVATTAG